VLDGGGKGTNPAPAQAGPGKKPGALAPDKKGNPMICTLGRNEYSRKNLSMMTPNEAKMFINFMIGIFINQPSIRLEAERFAYYYYCQVDKGNMWHGSGEHAAKINYDPAEICTGLHFGDR